MNPIRFFLRGSAAILWFLYVSVETLIHAWRHEEEASNLSRYSHRLSEGFVRIFRLRHRIRSWERLVAHQPCVYIGNHRSNLDVITMGNILAPDTVVIVKKELLKVPFLGTILRQGRCVMIDRKDRSSAVAGLSAAETAIVKDGLSIWIFPEGTRDFGRLLPFKRGAFHLARNAGVPIVPVVCAVTPGWLVGRRLRLKPHADVLIDVLDPIDPAAFANVAELTRHAEEVVAAGLAALEAEVRDMAQG